MLFPGVSIIRSLSRCSIYVKVWIGAVSSFDLLSSVARAMGLANREKRGQG